jgi:hypothetical protein
MKKYILLLISVIFRLTFEISISEDDCREYSEKFKPTKNGMNNGFVCWELKTFVKYLKQLPAKDLKFYLCR